MSRDTRLRGTRGKRAASALALLTLITPLAGSSRAHAATVSATLSSLTGEGTADRSLLCGAGDGQSWRYSYGGPVSPGASPLAGGWQSSIEVHEATPVGGARRAYIPPGTGRIRITTATGGTASLVFSGGTCSTGALALAVANPGDAPVVSGTLPYTVQGGTGPLRNASGSGTLGLNLTMGPGANNPGTIALSGALNLLAPKLGVDNAKSSAQYTSIRDYLGRKLTVTIPITNIGASDVVGDAFGVRVASAAAPGVTIAGVPAFVGEVDNGATPPVQLTLVGALPLSSYTITGRLTGLNALGEEIAPVNFTVTVSAPLLPELVL